MPNERAELDANEQDVVEAALLRIADATSSKASTLRCHDMNCTVHII